MNGIAIIGWYDVTKHLWDVVKYIRTEDSAPTNIGSVARYQDSIGQHLSIRHPTTSENAPLSWCILSG